MGGGSGYSFCRRSINGSAAGLLCCVGSLGAWSQVRAEISASEKIWRIVATSASSVSSVPYRRSSTRSRGLLGGGSVLTRAQQLSNTLRRRSSGTFNVERPEVHRADTNRTNCRSGMPGRWIFRVCIVIILIAAAEGVNFLRAALDKPLTRVPF